MRRIHRGWRAGPTVRSGDRSVHAGTVVPKAARRQDDQQAGIPRNRGGCARSCRRSGSQTGAGEWGSPVFDLHFHLRPQPASNLAHLDGAGITKANLLTRAAAGDQVKAVRPAAPGRFTWFSSADITKPEAEQALTAGRQGRRAGLRRDEVPRRRRRPRAAPDVRAGRRSARADPGPLPGGRSLPERGHVEHGLRARPSRGSSRPIRRRRSSGTPTRSGPTSAPTITTKRPIRPARSSAAASPTSCWPTTPTSSATCPPTPATTRCRAIPSSPPASSSGTRTSCCSAATAAARDGHGAGISQANNPAATRLAGKCVARETLTVLKKSASPAIFRKIVWDNAHKLLKIPA